MVSFGLMVFMVCLFKRVSIGIAIYKMCGFSRQMQRNTICHFECNEKLEHALSKIIFKRNSVNPLILKILILTINLSEKLFSKTFSVILLSGNHVFMPL
ncbi:hypothetical protein O71_15480 [Pontibacter sp. BAB1700]|nr:hypothetical protein O71_15480 [Pontibacter sp. BAB1700]